MYTHFSIALKQVLTVLILFCSVCVAAQEQQPPRPIDLPDLEKMGNFFKFRDEILPEDLSKKLEDIKKMPTGKSYRLVEEMQDSHIIAKHYKNDKLILSQSFNKKGIPDGMATVYHTNGKLRQEIPYINGMADGVGKAYDDDDFLKAETTYKNNKLHGLRKIHAYRGGGIEGSFDNGKAVGKITVSDARGVVYYYPPDMKHGIVEIFYKDMKVAEISIIAEEQRDGEQKEFTKDGKLKSIFRFKNGKRHGLTEYYKSDGTVLYSNNYNDGEYIGKYTLKQDDGTTLQDGFYDDAGARTGQWVYYDKSGKPEREMQFKNGKLNGIYKSYYKGVLAEETNYVNGRKEGASKRYDSNTGALSVDKVYKNDEVESYKSYYPNGKVIETYTAVPGKPSSKKFYDQEGNMIHEAKFNEKGKPIGEHKLIMLDGNSYRINSSTTQDDNGKHIKTVVYSGPGNKSYTEVSFDGELKHGPRTEYNAVTNEKKVTYYFKDKLVTEQEFKKLSH